MRFRGLGLGLLLGALMIAGCNSEDAENLKRDAGKLAETSKTSLSNATLAGKVNTVLSLRKGVDMSGLHLETKGGTITISGHVRNKEEKKRVIETVNGIRGVEKVVDKIRVQP